MEGDSVKIINTTYRLLDSFPDNEPLKHKAKEKALKILENLTLVSRAAGWTSLKKERAESELIDDIEVLKNYLRLGALRGWINGTNLLIILKEYDNIKSQISPRITARPMLQFQDKQDLLNETPQNDALLIYEKAKKNDENEAVRANNYPNKINKPLPSSLTGIINNQNKTSDRQEKILKILASREKTQVSDIVKEIQGITKRTIRRDLDGLLKNGKIIRMGEFNQIFYKVS